jgi:predicted nucleic acid-binding protein
LSFKYLLDTDIFIDYFNGQSYAVDFFYNIRNGRLKAYFSILTEGELLAGCRNWEEQEKVDALLAKLERIELSVAIIRKAAEYRRAYGKKYGTTLIDAIIAASAFYLEAKLVTRNLKHFRPIKEISLYKL